MADKILIETNILLDYLLEREPYFENAKNDVFLHLVCIRLLKFDSWSIII